MNNYVYRSKLKVRTEHVDFMKKMRLTSLMTLFQECCIAHTSEMGAGREKTLDRGLLWVILCERIRVERLPVYDEEIFLECYPGKTLGFFFPRQMVVRDEQGKELVHVGAFWALIDADCRSMIDPQEKGISIEGEKREDDLVPLMHLYVPKLTESAVLRCSYSQTDINGHMNNASYLGTALDRLWENGLSAVSLYGEEADRVMSVREIRELSMVFAKEIPMGKSFEISYGEAGDSYYCASPFFTLKFDFAESGKMSASICSDLRG